MQPAETNECVRSFEAHTLIRELKKTITKQQELTHISGGFTLTVADVMLTAEDRHLSLSQTNHSA